MVKMPNEVVEAINKDIAKIIATVDQDGVPHAIHVGSFSAPSNEMLIAANVLMKRTAKSLDAMKKDGKPASLLVLDGPKSYEVRCTVGDYITSGPMFDAMFDKFKGMGLTVQGVWTFTPVEVWNESASLEAGTKMV